MISTYVIICHDVFIDQLHMSIIIFMCRLMRNTISEPMNPVQFPYNENLQINFIYAFINYFANTKYTIPNFISIISYN